MGQSSQTRFCRLAKTANVLGPTIIQTKLKSVMTLDFTIGKNIIFKKEMEIRLEKILQMLIGITKGIV